MVARRGDGWLLVDDGSGVARVDCRKGRVLLRAPRNNSGGDDDDDGGDIAPMVVDTSTPLPRVGVSVDVVGHVKEKKGKKKPVVAASIDDELVIVAHSVRVAATSDEEALFWLSGVEFMQSDRVTTTTALAFC
jgi:hypothetical protein